MKILHVTIGNPKTHQGGLSQYCRELMEEQRKLGHQAVVLYPQGIGIVPKVKIKQTGQSEYAIINALPVAITYGIDLPRRYYTPCDKSLYDNFLQKLSPDIIHVHSIQGIHKEFFEAAKEQRIPVVFTTHDYYPICCNCTLTNQKGEVCNCNSPQKCAVCNYGRGLSKTKQMLFKSELYQQIKGSIVVKKIKKKTQASVQTMQNVPEQLPDDTIKEFAKLREYYQQIVGTFSLIHANSQATAEIYQEFFPNAAIKTVPITNKNISLSTHNRDYQSPINFAYMGGQSAHKGYFVFEKALDLMDQNGFTNWNAWFYGSEFTIINEDSRRYYKGYFNEDEKKAVWNKIDILIMPSQCRETFGFVVLEALSKQIPVLCSDLVGARSLVAQVASSDLIFHFNDANELSQKMRDLSEKENYEKVRKRILQNGRFPSMEHHTEEMCQMYRDVLNEKDY